jgi:hypothetical protein
MSKFKFEVFITKGEVQKTFELNDKPIIFGSTSSCDFLIEGEGPSIKALLQREEDHLLIKIFDTKHPVTLNGKKYKSAKLKKAAFFKISDFDIVFSMEELSTVEEELPDFEEDEALQDYEDTDQKTESAISPKEIAEIKSSVPTPNLDIGTPDIFDESTKTQINTISLKEDIKEIDKEVTDSRKKIKNKNQISLTPSIESDDFNFDISFDESSFKPELYQSFQNPNMDFSSYIDLKDETVKHLPTPEIHKKNSQKSVHVVHMNNGTSLKDSFFPVRLKRIFLSNTHEGKNYFQVHDCKSTKEEFLYARDEKVFVVCLAGYTIHKSVNNKLEELDEKAVEVKDGERIVLTRGTSQIVVQLSQTPFKIKTNRFFNVEEQLLKSVAMSCSLALFILALVVIYPAKKEEERKKELVILYKRQKVKIFKKKPQPPSKDVAKSDTKKDVQKKNVQKPAPKPKAKVVNKTKPKPQKVVKKITKVTPKKTPVKKVAKAKPKKTRSKVRKVVKRKAPAPAPKKKFKFNFGSKMNSMVSKSTNTKLKSAKGAKNVDIASSVSSASSVTSDFNTSKFGKTNSKVARFAAGKRSGKSSAIGTRGLSGKTRSTTAYIEANTKILGAMDPELIRKLMREYIPQFRHCYQRELLTNPSIAGVFDLAFQINARGTGVNVGVKSGGKRFSKKAMGCLKQVVRLIKFPKPKGGGLVDVKQPMNFYKQ